MMSMRRLIKGKTPEEIRKMKKDDLEQPVSLQDFEEGLAVIIEHIIFSYVFLIM